MAEHATGATIERGKAAPKQKKLQRLFRRVVPVEWEKELAELDAPPNDRFPWMKLIYEEGYPWEPVERYMIYTMIPARMRDSSELHQAVFEQLEDPHPPSAHGNYYDTVKEEFIRDPNCLITERAWHLFRETGCWGRPYWVIQGERGGHKRWFTRVERQILRMAKLPDTPPAPGDLPFAEWDDRVKKRLGMLNMLKGQHGERRRAAAEAKGHSVQMEREQEMQKQLRKDLLAFLKDQATEIAPDVQAALYKVDAPRKYRDKAEQIALEASMEEGEHIYVETGLARRSIHT